MPLDEYGRRYALTLNPAIEADRKVFAKIVRHADIWEDGSTCFNYMPLDDSRRRCPPGVNILCGPHFFYNSLRESIAYFESGKSVTFEVLFV